MAHNQEFSCCIDPFAKDAADKHFVRGGGDISILCSPAFKAERWLVIPVKLSLLQRGADEEETSFPSTRKER